MPSLKSLKVRIASVKSTRKITSAMKMVAAAKLRRYQDRVVANRPYSEKIADTLVRLSGAVSGLALPNILQGTGRDQVQLILIFSADRGLCGGFNINVFKQSRDHIQKLLQEGKEVKVITVGRKIRDSLRRLFPSLIIQSLVEIEKPYLDFAKAKNLSSLVLSLFEDGEFDVCTLIHPEFKSAISQKPVCRTIIPMSLDLQTPSSSNSSSRGEYQFEPSQKEILTNLLPLNIEVQIYKALLENAAGEQGARMTAMDNATRNAGDMIRKLSLQFNRTRQAMITKELIEIVSGAEAL